MGIDIAGQINAFFGISGTSSKEIYGVETPDLDLGEPDPCMPPPATLPQGDIGAELAALIVVTANQSKGAARQLQKSEEAMQKVAEQREINAMHKQAELKMASAIVGIVGNSISLVCTAAGAPDVAKPISGAIGGALDAEAAYKEADIKSFEHQADAAKRGASSAGDAVDDAKKLADKAIDFYSQWTQGKAQAASAAVHRT